MSKLSPFFFIALAFYVAFNLLAELNPILRISHLILPILIISLVSGKELLLIILFDLFVCTSIFIRSIDLIETMIYFNETLAQVKFLDPSYGILFFYSGILISRIVNWLSAEFIIRRKKIRERIGKIF